MPISNIKENLELARNKLLEVDKKDSIIEESTPAESTITEDSRIVVLVTCHLKDTASFVGRGN